MLVLRCFLKGVRLPKSIVHILCQLPFQNISNGGGDPSHKHFRGLFLLYSIFPLLVGSPPVEFLHNCTHFLGMFSPIQYLPLVLGSPFHTHYPSYTIYGVCFLSYSIFGTLFYGLRTFCGKGRVFWNLANSHRTLYNSY